MNISSSLKLKFPIRSPRPSRTRSVTFNQATSKLPSDNNNFGPRFGFAVGLTGDGKTSLRGGYGLYYGRTINSTIYNAPDQYRHYERTNPGKSATHHARPRRSSRMCWLQRLRQDQRRIQYFSPEFRQLDDPSGRSDLRARDYKEYDCLGFLPVQPGTEVADLLRSESEPAHGRVRRSQLMTDLLQVKRSPSRSSADRAQIPALGQ